jgi:uncharacterized protein
MRVCMKELVEFIARGLVDEQDGVEVEVRSERNAIVYHLFVNEHETGRVIGRDGKIANAIRVLMDCTAQRDRKQPILKVM